MKEITSIKELHGILFDIAKEFHRVCVENDIPYYMLGGTMIGAIRHKGFIPWDDDMDFGVPRAYYCKLQSVLKSELRQPYHVLTRADKIVVKGFLKIEDSRTSQTHAWDVEPNKQFGVNIDIFPLDAMNNKMRSRAIVELLLKIQSYKSFDASNFPFKKKLMAYIAKYGLFFLKRDSITNFVERHWASTEGKYWTNLYGAYGVRETLEKEIFGTPTLYQFEDTQFYGVEQYDKYLTLIYGNYMQLPPKEKQQAHIINAYYK